MMNSTEKKIWDKACQKTLNDLSEQLDSYTTQNPLLKETIQVLSQVIKTFPAPEYDETLFES